MSHIPSGVGAGLIDHAPASAAAPILCLFTGSAGASNPADRPRLRAGLVLFVTCAQIARRAKARQHG
ncbi:MAG: hypothetical protein ACK5ZG_03700 [Phycisphaerae bacterium]